MSLEEEEILGKRKPNFEVPGDDLKKTRIVNNNPESEDFTGPWGLYQGEK